MLSEASFFYIIIPMVVVWITLLHSEVRDGCKNKENWGIIQIEFKQPTYEKIDKA